MSPRTSPWPDREAERAPGSQRYVRHDPFARIEHPVLIEVDPALQLSGRVSARATVTRPGRSFRASRRRRQRHAVIACIGIGVGRGLAVIVARDCRPKKKSATPAAFVKMPARGPLLAANV